MSEKLREADFNVWWERYCSWSLKTKTEESPMQTAHAAWRAALAALPPEAPGWNEGSAPPETPAAPSTPPQTAGYGWEGDLAALVANPPYQQIERSKAELARLREQVAAVRDAVYDGEWECRACDTGNKIAARLTEALDKP